MRKSTRASGGAPPEVDYRLLLGSIRTPVLALSEDMTILYGNEAYAEFVGKPLSELEGQQLLSLFPQLANTPSYRAYLQVLETGEALQVEGPLGDRIIRSTAYRTPWGILAIAEDITAWKRAEEAVQRRAQEEEGLTRIAALAGSSLEVGELLDRVMEEARRLVGAETCVLFLEDKIQQALVGRYISVDGVPSAAPQEWHIPLDTPGFGWDVVVA